MQRQIVLDTETTGMNRLGIRHQGHGIVEIGAVEIINRRLTARCFHLYCRPNRLIDPAAIAVHGITDAFLQDKPTFAEIADEFSEFIRGAELIIHNAAFDVGFIDYEFQQCRSTAVSVQQLCGGVVDTLALARQRFPGKRNSLDALCSRYQIDLQKRTLHGALLDAELLAELYLLMTGGQATLSFDNDSLNISPATPATRVVTTDSTAVARPLTVLQASESELQRHYQRLTEIKQQGGHCLWPEALIENQWRGVS